VAERAAAPHTRITVGADKAYDVAKHVARLRAKNIIPHIAVNAYVTKTGHRNSRQKRGLFSRLLDGSFSILLGPEKEEVIRRSGSVTNRQAMAKGFGEVGFGRLYGVVHGFASCEMRRDG
jgi:hypothetical protein